jgi:MraZ protein
MVFRGTFDHTLDAKNRLTVPSKFRAMLSDGVVIARGIEGCAQIWQPARYEAFVEGALANVNPMTEQARKITRFFGAGSFETDLDAAGRIMVPAKIMQHAKLGKDVVVIGSGHCLEIWDRDTWSAIDDELSVEVHALTEALGGQV